MNGMTDSNEALKIWDALKPMIDREIKERTASCVRSKKMTVASAPNGSTIGVSEPFDTRTYNIPYSSMVKDANVGDTVWVHWYYDNASTMLAVCYGDGEFGPPSITVDFGTISSLPVTRSAIGIKSDMTVDSWEMGNPNAFKSNLTVTTISGSVTVSGTMSGSSTLKIKLSGTTAITGT